MPLTDIKVKDLLGEKRSGVETVPKTTTVIQAAQRMAEKRIGMLVVVNEMGNFVGVLSDGDVVRAVAERSQDISNVTIGELITTNITACQPENHLQEVLLTMKDKSIRHLPVLDNGQVVGIVSVGDLLRYLLENFDQPAKGGVFARLRRN